MDDEMKTFKGSGVNSTFSGRVGYTMDSVQEKPTDERMAFKAKFDELRIKTCIVCDSPKVTYMMYQFSFCSAHKANAQRFMSVFPTFATLKAAGLEREKAK
jgi:hypothetical protein